MAGDADDELVGIASLADPVRRALYRAVAASPDAVSRDQAAAAVGVQRSLAAFHLDKLAGEGLLDVEFRRLTGRSGPGAGRPAKLYRRADREFAVSLPPRGYDLAGSLLAAAVDAAEAAGTSPRAELAARAAEHGRRMGEEVVARSGRRPSRAALVDAVLAVLADHGFEPRVDGGDVVLANCPFHRLAREHTELVCGMNLRLLEGLQATLPVRGRALEPRLEPEPGRCCVKLRLSTTTNR